MKNKVKQLYHLRKNPPKKLTLPKERLCWRLIGHIQTHTIIKGSELAELLNVSEMEVRKLIQFVRERSHRFFNVGSGLYILAGNNGYTITSNNNKKKKYRHKLENQIKSKQYQLQELNIAIGEE